MLSGFFSCGVHSVPLAFTVFMSLLCLPLVRIKWGQCGLSIDCHETQFSVELYISAVVELGCS